MGVLVRAVITGFGFSLGKALFERVSDRIGFGDAQASQTSTSPPVDSDGDTDADRADSPDAQLAH